jgi:hypothetical protein
MGTTTRWFVSAAGTVLLGVLATTAVYAVEEQKVCPPAQLNWHTDFDEAKTEAARTGKPILSLRLLGKLTDELSCANSRFFRSTLYANADVSEFLQTHFVLHWKSVRPVPVVTIDFGDGRVLRRTVTGNSIHYILDAEGRVLDALPGLYGPAAFKRGLANVVTLAKTLDGIRDADRNAALVAYHEERTRAIMEQWRDDMQKAGIEPSSDTPDSMNDAAWGRIAELHRGDATLDAASIDVIRKQQPGTGGALTPVAFPSVSIPSVPMGVAQPAALVALQIQQIPAELAGALTVSKCIVEDPVLRLIRNLETSIAVDTVRNEYMLHRTIHEWLSTGAVPLATPVDELNERVYAELFLTPSSDPWLGLMTPDVYTALDNGGVVIQ